MKKVLLAAAAVCAFPAVAFAQDTASDTTADAPSDARTSGGLEPYVGLLGGVDIYDHDSEFGSNDRHQALDGFLVSAVAGVNVDVGPLFVGGEGNVAKGTKDINWEYGLSGRVGARTGKTGLIYVSAGYEWIRPHTDRGFPRHSDWLYGAGVELGPQDLGMSNSSSRLRLRLQADTYDFHSIRPMIGVVMHM
jgi:opacity protein-like surface antigen